MAEKQPMLSIGMIVKNEEKKLERCLTALQPLRDAIPCELVIADTGSTDGTRAIAERYADMVFDIQWTNDFSAARNAVMDRAHGTWYFTVDADEYLDADITEVVNFLTGPQSQKSMYATVIQRNYTSTDLSGEYGDFTAVRMLRMDTGLRYEGRIHERWNLASRMLCHHLEHTILHHDGYVYTTYEDQVKKAHRNLDLLEKELQETPDDSMRILQCMESSSTIVQKAVEYSHRGMELIQREPRIPYWDEIAGPICRKAINLAARYQMPEWDEWMTWGEENLADSPFIQVDVAYYRLCWLYHKQKYEQIPSAADRFCSAWHQFHKTKYDPAEFMISTLYYSSPRYLSFATIFKARAFIEQNQVHEGLQLLQTTDLHTALDDMIEAWLDAMECAAYDPKARQIAAFKLSPILLDADTQEVAVKRRQTVYTRIAKAFLPTSQGGRWRLYTEIQTDQGRGAQLYAATDANQAQEILSQITHWGEIPPTVFAHVLQLGAVLPADFYTQSANALDTIAQQLRQYDSEFIPHLLTQLQQTWPTDDFAVLNFDFDLVVAAVQSEQIPAQHEMEVYLWFGRVAHVYLQRMYHPDRLQNQQDIRFLPMVHQVCWYFLRAQSAAMQKNWTDCIHALREALAVAPSVKHMISRLMHFVENGTFPIDISSASPELLKLADQIRTILQQYAADDPAVQALKQSSAYQQVAYLLEDPDTKWTT